MSTKWFDGVVGKETAAAFLDTIFYNVIGQFLIFIAFGQPRKGTGERLTPSLMAGNLY